MKWTVIKKVPAEKNGMQYLKYYHNRKRFTVFEKNFIIDVWQGPKYASAKYQGMPCTAAHC